MTCRRTAISIVSALAVLGVTALVARPLPARSAPATGGIVALGAAGESAATPTVRRRVVSDDSPPCTLPAQRELRDSRCIDNGLGTVLVGRGAAETKGD